MATKRRRIPTASGRATSDVEAFSAACRHPLCDTLEVLRSIVRAAAPRLVEGIKWNAPSYRPADVDDDCITFNLSAADRVRIVFHRGSRRRNGCGSGRLLGDDAGLLEWAADDRAIATFRSVAAAKAAKAKLTKVVRAWLAAVARCALTPRASRGRRRGSSTRAVARAARGGSAAAPGPRR